MKQNDKELFLLKEKLSTMWQKVISQVERSKLALFNGDTCIAEELLYIEKEVNSIELSIDKNCENYIALFHPVAIDLRLVLSVMRISLHLERVADYVAGIAYFVKDEDCDSFFKKWKEELGLEEVYATILNMLTTTWLAFQSEFIDNAKSILQKDIIINVLQDKAFSTLSTNLHNFDNYEIKCAMKTLLLFQKLERTGDHCKNIVEELVFYIDAKSLKHKI